MILFALEPLVFAILNHLVLHPILSTHPTPRLYLVHLFFCFICFRFTAVYPYLLPLYHPNVPHSPSPSPISPSVHPVFLYNYRNRDHLSPPPQHATMTVSTPLIARIFVPPQDGTLVHHLGQFGFSNPEPRSTLLVSRLSSPVSRPRLQPSSFNVRYSEKQHSQKKRERTSTHCQRFNSSKTFLSSFRPILAMCFR